MCQYSKKDYYVRVVFEAFFKEPVQKRSTEEKVVDSFGCKYEWIVADLGRHAYTHPLTIHLTGVNNDKGHAHRAELSEDTDLCFGRRQSGQVSAGAAVCAENVY